MVIDRRGLRPVALAAVSIVVAIGAFTSGAWLAVEVADHSPAQDEARAAGWTSPGSANDAPDRATSGSAKVAPDPKTVLVFGTDEGSRIEPPSVLWMSLVAINYEAGKAAIVSVPAHSAAEIPGRGLLGVGDAFATGGTPLLLMSVENLLGVALDGYIELAQSDAKDLFSATGPLEVDVPNDVSVEDRGDIRIMFYGGLQELSPLWLARYWFTIGADEDDVELGPRGLALWDSLLDRFRSNPEGLKDALRERHDATSTSNLSPQTRARLLESLAKVDESGLTLTTLPVTQLSAGDTQLYSARPRELAAILEDAVEYLPVAGDTVDIQILNGNGVPGVGEEVAARLVGHGYRIALTGNADRLNYRRTLVVAYDRSLGGEGLARRVRDLLRVGEVQVASQGQGIVDLTIVVGKDFSKR